jgi:hypothetical protein
MRFLALVFILVAWAQPAAAATVTIRPSADAGLPFWCDWGYDWDERCYPDDGPRLPVGGVDDKVWRGALRFALGQIPAGAYVESARLRLFHDGTCVAPRLATIRCEGGSYALDAHRIVSARWFDEREVTIDERVASSALLADSATARWLAWDVTALVRAWHRGTAANNGLLLRLSEWQENYDVSGPAFPSSAFADASLRPRLAVAFTPGT